MVSSITPAMLVLLLRPYGYEVTQRCLTDWRRKGDLPQLERVSRGFRKGILRCWNQTDILTLALAVCRRRRGRAHKRTYGAVHKNWLSGADIPTSRAQQSWNRCSKRTARFPKALMRSAATELSAEIPLKADMIADVLNEIGRIVFQPNYTVGKTLDVGLIQSVAERGIKRMRGTGIGIAIDKKSLLEFLTCINAIFSPAGIRNAVASATIAELGHARDRYRDWWRGIGAFQQHLNSNGQPEPSLRTMLADALAPLIVPLLLPEKTLEGRLARLEAP